MGSIPEEEVIPRLEAALERLAPLESELAEIQLETDRSIRRLLANKGRRTDPLTAQRDSIIDEIVAIIAEHRGIVFVDGRGKPSKNVVLRGGTVKAYFSRESLVTDDAQLEAELRGLGLWRDNSIPQPRKLDKAKIKKNRALVAQLSDQAAHYAKKENLAIILPKQTVEVKEFANPLKRTISTSSND